MSHSNSFPTVITVSQQLNQAHFQQPATSQMQHHTAVVSSQILFPQCQQALSLQSSQNGSMTPSQQINNNNACGGNKQMQHNNQFQQQQQQQQHHLTIPVQLGAGNHAFTTAGIPLDLSYFVQGGCLNNCLPIQLASPGNLPQGFQAALNCVNNSNNSSNDPNQQQQVQVTQSDGAGGNSFLQFNFAYQAQPPQHNNSLATFHQAAAAAAAQSNSGLTTTPQQQPPPTPSAAPVVVTNTPSSSNVKRRKKPTTSNKQSDKQSVPPIEKYHSVAVQTEFDMSLCRQQIVVVPPKNCTCGAVAQAIASGAFQAASFPPGPRKPDKTSKIKRVNSSTNNKVESMQLGDGMVMIQQDEPQKQEQLVQSVIHQEQQSSLSDPCNGAPTQPNCDNRGRPFSYECIYCPKRFSLHSRLVAHLRCHTGMRPFSCLQCGYSFTQRSYLNRHAAVHKQERPFSCLSCHKTYKHYGSLANHRKLHTKDTSDPSINEASAISESVLPPSTISSVTSQMFSVSSSSITSPQIFTSSAVAHPAIMSQMFPVSSTSITAPQMFHASSSSANPSGSSQQMFQVSSSTSTPGVSQMFSPSNSQPMATFYQAHDASGFLLSLNSSATSSTGAAGTMLLLHPSNNNNSITVPSSSTSAYVPIMSSTAFS